jgi:uroporphyrinogen-III synthase
MRLLITRPEPDATRTAHTLRARGHEVLVAPLFETQIVGVDFKGPYGAVLMTSANAARAISRHPHFPSLRALPAFVVGNRTAEAARAAGFTSVESADGSLAELADLVSSSPGAAIPLLYLAGEDRAGDLAGDLAARGFKVETVVIYRAVAAECLPGELIQALTDARLDGALHYSRRSAATLLALAEKAGTLNVLLNLAHYCLSGEVAAPLRNAGAARVSVAPRPDEAALIGLLDR